MNNVNAMLTLTLKDKKEECRSLLMVERESVD